MKKNKKKVIIITVIITLLICIGLGIFFILNNNNKNALTLVENKWLDSNKYNVIDVSLMNDTPILSYNGEGLIYDYLDYVTDSLSLKFNVIPYKLGDTSESNYQMNIVDSPTNKDIVLLKDNMILVTNSNLEYKKVSSINNIKIGILSSDKDMLLKYFNNNSNIEFVEYNTYSDLKNSIISSKVDIEQGLVGQVDGIIILKTMFLRELVENDYNISFQFNDLSKYFVLSLNGSEELNSILSKKYSVWKESKYLESYNSYLLSNYFEFANVSDVEEKTLKSKSYVYGFINYGIYNNLDNNKISGMSGLILKDFNAFSGISITYTKYNSISTLLKDFESNEVDFMLNIVNSDKYINNVYNTSGVFNKDLVVISGISQDIVIDGIYSLKDKEVLIVKDTYLEKELISLGVNVKLYNNLQDLASSFSDKSIAIVDLENYNYYKSSKFKDSKINYLMEYEEKYNYVINDIEENRIFKNLFNFYLMFNPVDKLISSNYEDIAYENSNIIYILLIVIVILLIYIVIDFSNHIKVMIKSIKKSKAIHLSKADKIKYIDQLTSLKNRAYLNSKIESWDDSEVYPQSIIIIDLNNISYINDNYGREEGDKVITEAANILIQHQLQNSEIIRTDGNEFLIYLVGYNEKQIISYLRKLSKELKTLSHGFGAASGYSIITDAIKTVDDAVQEATIAMKENKEDIDY